MIKRLLPVADNDMVKRVLIRATEIVEAEGLMGYLYGYEPIERACREMGYDFSVHRKAASAFINACNSTEIKLSALRKATEDLG